MAQFGKWRGRPLVLATLAVGMVFSAVLAEDSFLLSGPPAEATVDAPEKPANVKVVYGRGTGETKEEAEKDACRNAVEFAVGTFIDSETQLKNEQLIKDEILSHSNGYIEKYEVTGASRSKRGLGIEVDVKAWVKMQEARKKVRDLVPGDAQKVDGIDGITFANESKERRDKSAAALLKKELDGLDPVRQLVNIKLASSKPTVLEGKEAEGCAANEVILRYYCQFYLMQDVYFKRFMPRFTQILEQISVHKPVTFRPVAKCLGDYWKRDNSDWVKGLGNVPESFNNIGVGLSCSQMDTLLGRDGRVVPYLGSCFALMDYRPSLVDLTKKLNGGTKNRPSSSNRDEPTLGRVEVITKCNASLTTVRGKAYFLAPQVYAVYLAWFKEHFVERWYLGGKRARASVDYLLRLMDKEGEEVASRKVRLSEGGVLFCEDRQNEYEWKQRGGINGFPPCLVWGPWLNSASGSSLAYSSNKTPVIHMTTVIPIDIRISKEDARLVKSVSVSLAEAVD